MARRRNRKQSDLDALVQAPWQVSAVLAVGAFIGLRFIAPAMLVSNPFTVGLAAVAIAFAPWVSLFLGAIAALAFFRKTHHSVGTSPTSSERAPRRAHPVNATQRREEPDPVQNAWESSTKTQTAPTGKAKPAEWTFELLKAIEWKRFEAVTAAYFTEKSFQAEMLEAGPDGGVDVRLFVKGKEEPFAIVQCKAWKSQRVGVAQIRELLGVMTHQKVSRGIFVTSGQYSDDAIEFAKGCAIQLISGDMLIKGIMALPPEGQAKLLAVATEGDYLTPTCPSCGVKTVMRDGKRGAFWGCQNYPRCRYTLSMSSSC